MLIKLYVVNDSDNTINKVKKDEFTLEIKVKRDFDLKNPEIVILDSELINIRNFNYFYIPDLNMYYFINSLDVVGNKLYKISGSCDVIESFKLDILNSKASYLRNIRNGDYIDGNLDYSTKKTITKHISDKGLDGETSLIMTTLGA